MYKLRRDEWSFPVAIECDGVTVVHLAPSTRTLKAAEKLVTVLNNAQLKLDWRRELGLEGRA